MEHLTTAQAAFVVGQPLDSFKKVVERAPIKPKLVKRGGRKIRQFGQAELVFLHAYDELKEALTPKSQTALYVALRSSLKHGSDKEVVFGKQRYDIHQHLVFVDQRLKELGKLADQIDASRKEPVVRGTQIEAYRLASLIDGGMSVKDILRDYPSLREQQIVAAKAYAEANPKKGRPYPKQSAKAAMRAADLSALDD